jgi:hypothetical protein
MALSDEMGRWEELDKTIEMAISHGNWDLVERLYCKFIAQGDQLKAAIDEELRGRNEN